MALIDDIIQIPIWTVLDKLWIWYKKKSWDEFSIFEDWVETDWRRFNISKNFVEDFAHDRPQGNPFAFVRAFLKIDDKQTYEWFEHNFWIDSSKKTIDDFWRSYSDLNDVQIEYLRTRCIDYSKLHWIIKNVNGGIWCALYDWFSRIGIKIRRVTDDKSMRYVSVAWYSWDWLYMSSIDPSKNYLIVVEWMTDFLTLRQFETNVVGLSSATAWIQTVKNLSKEYEIFLVTDNDDAGKWVIQQMNWISYSWFDVSQVDKKFKDINDVVCSWYSWQDVITAILEGSEYQAPISAAFERYFQYQKKMRKQWKLGIDWPFPELYNLTSWVIPWKVYAIWAYSNTGKSKYAYYHAAYFLRQWKKVLFLNLEVDTEFFMANMISAMENVTMDENKTHSPTTRLYKNLVTYDNIYKINDIENVVMDSWADIVFIDFIQNVEAKWWWEYEKMAYAARAIQRLAIQSHATIFILSQVANDTAAAVKEWKDTLLKLKWGGELFASSDVVMFLSRSPVDWYLRLRLEKNKFWRTWVDFMLKVDYERNQFALENIDER